MKQLCMLLALLISICISGPSKAQVTRLIKQLHDLNDKNVMVAAHRGDWRNAPENSLEAYRLAMAAGVDIIETDLALSKDSVLIILHDQYLNRSTTGKGKPSDYTLTQLKAFRLRDGLGVPTHYQIPTLEEVMLLAKDKVLVNLDHSTPFYREAYRILQKTRTLRQAIFKSDEPYAKLRDRYGALLDSLTFMPVAETSVGVGKSFILDYQRHLKPVAVELVFDSDTLSVVRDNRFIRQNGAKLWINSLWPDLCGGHHDDLAAEGNFRDSWDWLIARGVSIIQTDRPRLLVDYLRKRKLHP